MVTTCVRSAGVPEVDTYLLVQETEEQRQKKTLQLNSHDYRSRFLEKLGLLDLH
ncbi:hypothetical protein DPMN_176698 [Dreissena polymorpha]|uniref:Uncharacterized protein n=1 Tax=Dreissena polymorpha TaxID=45954 RepID=A0A9D4IJV4_DREPO|nr:hypothetical protein DPMN_176698 [Dreissena polymorpha]